MALEVNHYTSSHRILETENIMCVLMEFIQSLESTVGVPQISCLGPLLFFIYTNDLNYLLENEVNHVLFADDTSKAYCCEDPAVLGFKLNCWLYKILDWCNYNKLIQITKNLSGYISQDEKLQYQGYILIGTK